MSSIVPWNMVSCKYENQGYREHMCSFAKTHLRPPEISTVSGFPFGVPEGTEEAAGILLLFFLVRGGSFM